MNRTWVFRNGQLDMLPFNSFKLKIIINKPALLQAINAIRECLNNKLPL